MKHRIWMDRRQAIGWIGMASLLTACTKAPMRVGGNADAEKPSDSNGTIPETIKSGDANPLPKNDPPVMSSPKPKMDDMPAKPMMGEMPANAGPVKEPIKPEPDKEPMKEPETSKICVLSPAQIEGPYFVDEKINRSDIRADTSNNQLQAGIPLTLTFFVSAIKGMSCTPLVGATFDIWQANADGIYSDVEGAIGRKYLRGFQITDKEGKVSFKTVYPGWYPGRTAHIHIKVRTYDAAKKLTLEFTTQIYFDDAVSKAIYANSPAYKGRGGQDTTNQTDGFYRGAKQLLVALEKDGDGYKGSLDVGVKV